MNHQQYQSLLQSALHSANDREDYKAIAAIVAGGDQLYLSQDWSNWTEEGEQYVFGMLMALRILGVEENLAGLKNSPVYKTAVEMLDQYAVDNIATQVFGE